MQLNSYQGLSLKNYARNNTGDRLLPKVRDLTDVQVTPDHKHFTAEKPDVKLGSSQIYPLGPKDPTSHFNLQDFTSKGVKNNHYVSVLDRCLRKDSIEGS